MAKDRQPTAHPEKSRGAETLHAFLRSRHSIRSFKSQSVPAETIQRILETATYAPSAHNDQPWRFTVLTTAKAKSQLAEAMAADFRRDLDKDGLTEDEITARLERSRRRMNEAPIVIILCMDAPGMEAYADAKRQQAESTMAVQSTALAGLQLLLAAHAEGLGGVWTCGPLFAPEAVKSTLGLPPEWQPQAMIFIGYPAEKTDIPRHKPLTEVVKFVP